MASTVYLEVGQRWVREDLDEQVRVVDLAGNRWVVETIDGRIVELPAGQLRSQYRFAGAGAGAVAG